MKPTTKFALTAALISTAALSPFALSTGEEEQKQVAREDLIRQFESLGKTEALPGPPVPVVPEGTKMTDELRTSIALINTKLIDPMRTRSNRRVLMSRIRVRMEEDYHFAITDTSESLFPFDVYKRHLRGEWEKIASGVCSPGMESVKVAMPETGVMVDPVKHPVFAAALTIWKRADEKRAG